MTYFFPYNFCEPIFNIINQNSVCFSYTKNYQLKNFYAENKSVLQCETQFDIIVYLIKKYKQRERKR